GVRLREPFGAVFDSARGAHGQKDGRGALRGTRRTRLRSAGGKSKNSGSESPFCGKFGSAGGEAEGKKRGGRNCGICARQAYHAGHLRTRAHARLAKIFVSIRGAPIFEGIPAG